MNMKSYKTFTWNKTKESPVVFSGTIRMNKIKMPNRKYKAMKSTKCDKSV